MRIAILSRRPDLYSTRRLYESAIARGHEAIVINTLRCYMNIAAHKPTIYYKGKELTDIDAVIPRIGAAVTFYGAAVVRQFEMKGIFCVNESVAITRSRDKLRSFQLLARKGVGLPITGFADSVDDINDLITMVGGPPCIIKLIAGTQGKGVILAETKKAVSSVVEAFLSLETNIMVQEFISEARGADIRCFVVDNKVVATMKRQAPPGEFRSNLHCGGEPSLVKISAAERQAALRAAKIMGLNVAGVDLIRSNRGPLVLEVNSSPGLQGIEKATGKDVAGMIINFIEKNVGKHSSRTRGKG
jgi:ribosomal protein S6--L-glutamate ligase